MIYLKELSKKHATETYLKWMNDYKVHQFTEQKNKRHKLSDIIKFIKDKKKSKFEFLYGIFLKKKKTHIGNIKLGPILPFHKTAFISYFIGEKKLWGKGYGKAAISEILKIAKKKGLKKIQAGVYEFNTPSINVLVKNKFKLEGVWKSGLVFKNKRCNHYWYGLEIK